MAESGTENEAPMPQIMNQAVRACCFHRKRHCNADPDLCFVQIPQCKYNCDSTKIVAMASIVKGDTYIPFKNKVTFPAFAGPGKSRHESPAQLVSGGSACF